MGFEVDVTDIAMHGYIRYFYKFLYHIFRQHLYHFIDINSIVRRPGANIGYQLSSLTVIHNFSRIGLCNINVPT